MSKILAFQYLYIKCLNCVISITINKMKCKSNCVSWELETSVKINFKTYMQIPRLDIFIPAEFDEVNLSTS